MAEPWRGDINGVLYCLIFSRRLDAAEVDRLATMILGGRSFARTPEQISASLAAALASDERLTGGLIDQPHPEPAVRGFLTRLAERLAQRPADTPAGPASPSDGRSGPT
jgi:hypothetical protein